jgi:hypothetical protein
VVSGIRNAERAVPGELSRVADEGWTSAVRHGPLASMLTIYETPDGRRCIVTFASRGADVLNPVRNDRGDLWVGYLLDGDEQPPRFEDWERGWVAAELLRPVGELDIA